MLKAVHHVAIICADYERSKSFYSETLGLPVLAENFRADRQSWKLDLALSDGSQVELFSFPGAPERSSHPRAEGLTPVWLSSVIWQSLKMSVPVGLIAAVSAGSNLHNVII